MMLYVIFFVANFLTLTLQPSAVGAATTAVTKPTQPTVQKRSAVMPLLPPELSNIVKEYYDVNPNQVELRKLWLSETSVPGKKCNCDVSENGQTLLVVSSYLSHNSTVNIYKLEHGQWEHVGDKIIDFSAQPSILAATVSTVIDRKFSFTFDKYEQEWQSARLSLLDNKEGTISGNGTIMAWESHQNQATVTVRMPDGKSMGYVLPPGFIKLQAISFDGNYVVLSDRNKEHYTVIQLMGNSIFKVCELFTKNTRPFAETVRCINISKDNNYLLVGSGHGKWAIYARNISAKTPNCWAFEHNFNIGNNGYMTFNTNPNIVAALTVGSGGFEVNFYKKDKGEWQKNFSCDIKSPQVEVLRQSNSSGHMSLLTRVSADNCSIHIINTDVLYEIFNLNLDQLILLNTLHKKDLSSSGSSIVLDEDEVIEFNGMPKVIQNKIREVYTLNKNKDKKSEELCVIS